MKAVQPKIAYNSCHTTTWANQPTRMHSQRIKKPRRRLQVSLGCLLASVLILGPILGLGGPIAVRIVRELRTPRPFPASAMPPTTFDPLEGGDYYESAETPLD